MNEGDAHDDVTCDSAFDTMLAMQQDGRIEHVGLSNVTLEQLRRARPRPDRQRVEPVQLRKPDDTATLEYCTQNGIPYLPWGPRGYGATDAPPACGGLTADQARIAWLLDRSPVTVVIAGTSSVQHLEENVAAAAGSQDVDNDTPEDA